MCVLLMPYVLCVAHACAHELVENTYSFGGTCVTYRMIRMNVCHYMIVCVVYVYGFACARAYNVNKRNVSIFAN